MDSKLSGSLLPPLNANHNLRLHHEPLLHSIIRSQQIIEIRHLSILFSSMQYSFASVTLIAFLALVEGKHVLPGKFELAGRSRVPVMHAALLPSGKVAFLDKLENYTESKLPSGRYAYSTIYDPDTQELSPLALTSNAFCCGGAFLADGTLLTMGGNGPLDFLDDTIQDGFDALRYLYPGDAAEIWVQYEGVRLDSKR